MYRFVRNLFIGRAWTQPLFMRLLKTSLTGLSMIGAGGSIEENGEARTLRFLLTQFPYEKDPVIFDVGAQGGDYTKEALKHQPRAHVFAFEPSEKSYNILHKMFFEDASKKHDTSITLSKIALGEKDTESALYSADAAGVDSLVCLPDTEHNAFRKGGTVQVRSLDSFCLEHKITHIDLIKIDVEGGELGVLKGAQKMLAAGNIRFVEFEHTIHAAHAGYSFRDIFKILSPQYKIYRILKNGLWPIESAGIFQDLPFGVNYLAVSKKV